MVQSMPSRRGLMRSGVLAALLFMPVGLFAAWFGAWDAFSARELQYRLLGIVFMFAAITIGAATTCLFHPRWSRTYCREAAVLAGMAGVGVGIYLLAMQLTAPGTSTGWSFSLAAIPWAAIVVASLGAVGLAWRATARAATDLPHDAVPADEGVKADSATRSEGSRGMRILAKGFVSLGVSASLLWGAAQFWYTNQYLPGTVDAALSISSELKELPLSGAKTGDRIFVGRIAIKNVSTTKVQVVSSVYSVVRV